jgi:hypothetical protein
LWRLKPREIIFLPRLQHLSLSKTDLRAFCPNQSATLLLEPWGEASSWQSNIVMLSIQHCNVVRGWIIGIWKPFLSSCNFCTRMTSL